MVVWQAPLRSSRPRATPYDDASAPPCRFATAAPLNPTALTAACSFFSPNKPTGGRASVDLVLELDTHARDLARLALDCCPTAAGPRARGGVDGLLVLCGAQSRPRDGGLDRARGDGGPCLQLCFS